MKDGVATVKLSDGSTAQSAALDFGSDAKNELYDKIPRIEGMAPESADALIGAYSETSGISAQQYARAVEDGYLYGSVGLRMENIPRGSDFWGLSESQRKLAYELGTTVRAEKDAAREAEIEKQKAAAREKNRENKKTVTRIKDENMQVTDNSEEHSVSEKNKAYAENFQKRIDSWDGKTDGFAFVLGETPSYLSELEVNRKKIGKRQIRIDATKIKKIMRDHPEMTTEVIKNLPYLLNDPILVLDSKTVDGRLVVLGEIYAKGRPVIVVLEINPTTRRGNSSYVDVIKVASAYTRKDTQNLINSSNVRFVNENKSRVDDWLKVNRLQLPLPNAQSNSATNSIPDSVGNVNSSSKNNSKEAKAEAIRERATELQRAKNISTGESIVIDRENAIARVVTRNGNHWVYFNTDKGVLSQHEIKVENIGAATLSSGLAKYGPEIANRFLASVDAKDLEGVDPLHFLFGVIEGFDIGQGKSTESRYFDALPKKYQELSVKLGRENAAIEAKSKEMPSIQALSTENGRINPLFKGKETLDEASVDAAILRRGADGGGDVTIDREHAIARTETVDGERVVYFNTDKGEVRADDLINYGNVGAMKLREAVAKMEPVVGNAVYASYDSGLLGDLSTLSFVRGMQEGVEAGRKGADASNVESADFDALPESYRELAVKLGEFAQEIESGIDVSSIEREVDLTLREAMRDAKEALTRTNEGNTQVTDNSEEHSASEKNKAYAENFQKRIDAWDGKTDGFPDSNANVNSNSKNDSKNRGGVRFADDFVASALTKREKKSLYGLRVLAKALRVNFVIHEEIASEGNHKNANGWYDLNTGEIHIALNANHNGTMLFTAAHELTHLIRDWAPRKFKVFADLLLERFGEEGVSLDTLIQNQIDMAAENGRELSFDEAYEEVVADACEKMLADKETIAEISRELKARDKSLWGKVKKFLSDFYARIRDAYEGVPPSSEEGRLLSEMEEATKELRKLWVDALLDATDARANSATSVRMNKKEIFSFSESQTTHEGSYKYENCSAEDYYTEGKIYSYDFLTAQKQMVGVALPQTGFLTGNSGKIDDAKVLKAGINNALSEGAAKEGKIYVKNTYTGRSLRIDHSTVKHGLDGTYNRHLTNARIGSVIGSVVKNAIPINGLKNTAEKAVGTYAMISYCYDNLNRQFIAVITVEQHSGNIDGFELYDVAHAVSGRQKKGSQVDTKSQGVYPIEATTISIADLLRIVNTTHQSILSEDVLNHLGETRNSAGSYADKVLFSTVSDDTSNRALLANTPESEVQDETERRELSKYKEAVAVLEAEERKRKEIKDEIRALEKDKRGNAKKIQELRQEELKSVNRIDLYEEKILGLEMMKPIKRIAERQAQKAYEKAAERGRETLTKRRESINIHFLCRNYSFCVKK